MKIFNRTEIETLLGGIDPMPLIEQGFVDYSAGKATIPPVGELLMEKGEVHIKYGCIKGGDHYVVKVASGFYGNAALGLPSSNGMMLLFDQNTGTPVCVLADEGYLTDIRTAVAGAIAAKHLAPSEPGAIGIVGTGIQARLQARFLKSVTDCRTVVVWGRDAEKARACAADIAVDGFEVRVVTDIADLAQMCRLIVTTTPAHEPILLDTHIQPGTHITAMGSDTPDKQELDASILARADLVIADSFSQCLERGEIFRTIQAGKLKEVRVQELGNIISKRSGRAFAEQITVADLTGVAVQDLKIAEAVFLASRN